MPEPLWKKAERKICAMLGGKRRGATGQCESDCEHEWLAVEIKCNRRFPAYLDEWMEQAESNAEVGKLPLVVWHDVGDPYAAAVVILRLCDFLAWFGNGAHAEGEEEGDDEP